MWKLSLIILGAWIAYVGTRHHARYVTYCGYALAAVGAFWTLADLIQSADAVRAAARDRARLPRRRRP